MHILRKSSIRIQYTTASPWSVLAVARDITSVNLAKGVCLSAFAAFSAVAILFGKNLTSFLVFFSACAPELGGSSLPAVVVVANFLALDVGVKLRGRFAITVGSLRMRGRDKEANAVHFSGDRALILLENVEDDVDVDARPLLRLPHPTIDGSRYRDY